MNINSYQEEGLYSLTFFNCFQPMQNKLSASDLNLKGKEGREPEKLTLSNNNYYNYYNNMNEIKLGVAIEVTK